MKKRSMGIADSIGFSLLGWLVLYAIFIVPEYVEMGTLTPSMCRIVRSLAFGLFAGYLGSMASSFFDDAKTIRLILEDR